MDYDLYVVLPEEVASSVIFNREEEEPLETHLEHVKSCGLVSKIWCFCIAKYGLILARNEFSTANYVAARRYVELSCSLNVDPSLPASIYIDFALFVYRQINNPRRGCESGFIEESLNKDSDEKSNALIDIVTNCLRYSCPEERSTYFEPPSSPKKSALVQRSLDTNKLFTTPLIPLPVEPRSFTLQTMEQVLSLLEVKDFDISQLLKMIRAFASQGPAERKYLASRYILPRLVNLHLGHENNPMRHPDTDIDDYTQQITTKHQLAVVFMIGAELDKSYATSTNNKSGEHEKMDIEPSDGSRNVGDATDTNILNQHAVEGSTELIHTTQLDLDMLFHKSFIKDVILTHVEIAKKIMPYIKDFIQHWSYQNQSKTPFFNELFESLFKSEYRRVSMIVDLLRSYTEIEDELTESRVAFVTNLLIQHCTSPGYDEIPPCATLLQALTVTHPRASEILLERRKEWLVKLFTAPKHPELVSLAEEIMTDLLWLQTDKQPVSLFIETFFATFEEKPIEILSTMNLSSIFHAVDFLSLQLENKDVLMKALPTLMNVMFACNKLLLQENRNNIATLTYLKGLMSDDVIGMDVTAHVTEEQTFKQLLEWRHDKIEKINGEYQCEFYTFNHLPLYYSVIQQCCRFNPECLKLAIKDDAFINVILSHVVFAPIYLADCINLVSELLDQAAGSGLKSDLEVFYTRFNIALVQAAKTDFLIANFGWIVRLLDESLQYPAVRENFIGSATRPRAPGLKCLARLVQKAAEIDPFGIYNFDTTKLLWRLYELINDVVLETIDYSASPELIWTNLNMEDLLQDKGIADGLLQAVITINERILPTESTAFNLGTKLIDAINHEKDLVNKKNQVTDEAPTATVPDPNPVQATTASDTEGSRCNIM